MQLLDNIAIIIFQMISCREVLYSIKTKVKIYQHCEDSCEDSCDRSTNTVKIAVIDLPTL